MSCKESPSTICSRLHRPQSRVPDLAIVRRSFFLTIFLLLNSILAGCSAAPAPRPQFPPGYPVGYVERGIASWYGPGFHGHKTSNGEQYDMHRLTAAHRTLPIGSVVVVRCVTNGRTVTVRINDRGPFAKARIIDLSHEAARTLAMIGPGTGEVELKVVGYEGRPGAFGYLRIQVGSFAEVGNAQAMAGKLRDRFPARIITVDLPEGRRYRVQVGEFTSESEAQEVAGRLEVLYRVSALILRDDV